MYFVGCLCITDLINAKKMGHAERLRIVVCWDISPCSLLHEYRTTRYHIQKTITSKVIAMKAPKTPLIKLRGQSAVCLCLKAAGAYNMYLVRRVTGK